MTATLLQPPTKPDIDRLIERADALIADVLRIDPIAATLLGLAKAELVACRAVECGKVLRFSTEARRAH